VTETGNWSANGLGPPLEKRPFPISYSIPLAEPSEHVVLLNKAETENSTTTPKEGCELETGVLEATPVAPAGTLCVFTRAEEEGSKVGFIGLSAAILGDTPAGTYLWAETSEVTPELGQWKLYGTWAVTAK